MTADEIIQQIKESNIMSEVREKLRSTNKLNDDSNAELTDETKENYHNIRAMRVAFKGLQHVDRATDIMLCSKFANSHEVGNCQEISYVIYVKLFELLSHQITIELFELKGGDHMFVVLNRSQNNKNKSLPDMWGRECIIVDGWADEEADQIYPAVLFAEKQRKNHFLRGEPRLFFPRPGIDNFPNTTMQINALLQIEQKPENEIGESIHQTELQPQCKAVNIEPVVPVNMTNHHEEDQEPRDNCCAKIMRKLGCTQ